MVGVWGIVIEVVSRVRVILVFFGFCRLDFFNVLFFCGIASNCSIVSVVLVLVVYSMCVDFE